MMIRCQVSRGMFQMPPLAGAVEEEMLAWAVGAMWGASPLWSITRMVCLETLGSPPRPGASLPRYSGPPEQTTWGDTPTDSAKSRGASSGR